MGFSFVMTTGQMYEIDRLAGNYGVSEDSLMQNAGQAVAGEIIKRYLPCSVLVLCGPGNNGGDGLIAAGILKEHGWDTAVEKINEKTELSPSIFYKKNLIIDAIFGAGLSRPVEGNVRKILEELDKVKSQDPAIKIVAIDIPSGVKGDTGQVLGYAPHVDLTVTFTHKKPGHLLLPGKKYCGEVIVRDIGHPEKTVSAVIGKKNESGYIIYENNPALWLDKLPFPAEEKHKYNRGHAAVIGGNLPMTGAAKLASLAALRTSAGLVTIACPPDALDVYAKSLLAVMVKPVSDIAGLHDFLVKKNSVLIGPGAGINDRTRNFTLDIITSGLPCVIDADAISCLSDTKLNAHSKMILTPHEGEFRRLFELTDDKLNSVWNAVKSSGAAIILKGNDTIIASPDGRIAINSNAPPTLATAGSGDVLSGILTGLLASGMNTFEAACASVWIHGECANKFGKPGLISEDLINLIPEVLNYLYSVFTS